MTVQSNRLGGYLRFRILAGLRRWRPRSFRYAEEQQRIADWLDLIRRAAAKDAGLAREIADCARLIKGYGDTFKRGTGNFQMIRDRVIVPLTATSAELEKLARENQRVQEFTSGRVIRKVVVIPKKLVNVVAN